MQIELITEIFTENKESKYKKTKEVKESLKREELELYMLHDIEGAKRSFLQMGCLWDYKCGQTKYGYRITETTIHNKSEGIVTRNKFQYN